MRPVIGMFSYRRPVGSRALALAVRPIALRWIDAGETALHTYLVGTRAEPLLDAAFRTAFAAPPGVARALFVLSRLAQARAVIVDDARYEDVSDADALALFAPGTALPPAYARFGIGMSFTSAFARFGPMCRAAMLLHESVHVFDAESGLPENHVSEWDEPRFSAQTPEQSLRNPSAYVCFATQIHERVIAWPAALRYGAARPDT